MIHRVFIGYSQQRQFPSTALLENSQLCEPTDFACAATQLKAGTESIAVTPNTPFGVQRFASAAVSRNGGNRSDELPLMIDDDRAGGSQYGQTSL